MGTNLAVIENEYGKITIDNEVIAKIAGLSAMECYGVVGMSAKGVKDDFARLLKLESITKGVKLKIEDNRINITFHIIVEYGTNISAIAKSLISNVKYRVEEEIGLKVGLISIFVDGVRVD